jgi:hypothetical protein
MIDVELFGAPAPDSETVMPAAAASLTAFARR